jgi:hypothetical protein
VSEPRPARGLLILAPLLAFWLLAWAVEEGVGFAPAAAQSQATTTSNRSNPGPRPTQVPPSTMRPPTTATPTTFMPPTSTAGGSFPDPTNATPRPAATSPGRRDGVRWVCAPNAGAPGTHCWDP